MAFGSAAGKKTTLSKPAAGTIKKISTSTSAVGIVLSKQSKEEDDAIDRIDSAPPAEIISIADFNRIYELGAVRGKSGKTPYGLYYDALRSIHSITTEDVSYVISKALQNDVGGQWESLRSATENDVKNAKDLVNDLARFLNSVELAENSLDFGRNIDERLTYLCRKFLSNRLRPYEKQPENRNFDPKNILGDEYENDSNTDVLRKMLGILRETLTLEDEQFYKELMDGVSQKRENDLNAPDAEKLAWDYIDALPDAPADRMAACAELISHVLSLSVGIPRVQDESISSKIAFKPSKISSIFDGTEIKLTPGKSVLPSSFPPRKNLNKVGPPSSTVALSLLQFNASDGKAVIPVEVEDPPQKSSYRSGPTALIRKPILEGEFTFSDLQSFSDKFEESRGDIETYLNLMVGRLDPLNSLTPIEVFRIILKNFIEALDYTTQSFDSMLQFLATKFSVGGLSMGRNDVAISQPRQHILRSAARIKYYQLKSVDLTSTDTSEGVGASQTITSTRLSENSTSILSNAKVSTSLTTSLSSGSGKSKLGKRIIARLASDSPTDEEVASSMYDRIVMLSKRNAMSKQDINNKISEKTRELNNLKEKRAAAERELVAAIGVTAYATLLTAGLAAGALVLAGGGSVVNNAIKKLNFYTGKVESTDDEIKDLKELLRDAVTFLSRDVALISLKEAQKKTSGNFLSQVTKAYNEIVSFAESRLPPDELMTNESGTTRYGNLDEFGLMSLVTECFVQLAMLADVSSEVDSRRNINPVRPSKGAVKSLKSDLATLFVADDETELGSIECSVGEPARVAALKLLLRQQRFQDTMAYLSAFSQGLNDSADTLISSTADLLSDFRRRQVIDNAQGRQLLESLTSQQIVYRRSLLERYIPKPESGYIPARVAYSLAEDSALNDLLSSPAFSSRSAENRRIITLAIPTGMINNEKRYVERDIGEINRSGMFEVIVGRKDHELDDLIFKEKIFLFDPQLFVVPSSFTDFLSQKTFSDADAALVIAKRIKFLLCDRDKSELLSYSELKSNPRYASLSSKQFEEIVRNITLSYLMENYTFKLCGTLADEIISLDIDDSTSQSGISALVTLAGLNLPDVVLPSPTQINAAFGADGEINISASVGGLTTGDKELLANLTSSMLMRNDTLTDRVLLRSKFDRVVSIVVDPDEFEIDRAESIKQNGAAARAMLQSLSKQGLIIQSGSTVKLRPRDPLSGGFSIGSVYCQFVPHTTSSEPGTLLRIAKQSLSSRLTNKISTGLTSKQVVSKATTKKSAKSATNSNRLKKSSR